MNKVTLLTGDCIKRLKGLKDNSVDSVVTDPPYEIGFMGKGWDDSGIANNPKLWKEVLRVLKPGGHLLSFSHSRTYHRQAVAVEDAGFEIRDQIMWVYGSGFPKSHNIGKALDKNGGNGDLVYEVAEKLKQARESRGITKTQADKLFCNGSTNYSWLEGRKDGVRLPEDDLFQTIVNEWPELKEYQEKVKSANREIVGNYDTDMGGLGGERLGNKGGDITLPSTPIAKQYEGWGTALKPAHEPIVMARKPLSEKTVARNVLEYGTGGINIDGCRVGNEERVATTQGRFPANIIFDEEDNKEEWRRYFYCPKASKKDRNDGNIHPTVKPTDLMAYLIRLVTPKGGLVLDPFMGSGSTGKGAIREGMDFIGIEREDEYMEISKTRILHEQMKHNYKEFFDI